MEKLLEEMTELKFEKMAEVKSTYDLFLKKLQQNSEKNAEKIEKMKSKRQDALTKAQNEIDQTKKQKINEIKEKYKAKKQELNKEKDQTLSSLQNEQSTIRRRSFSTRMSMNLSRIHGHALGEGSVPAQGDKRLA